MDAFLRWLFTSDVLQTLFDGVLGASVGAAVAVVVLRLTLREQRLALDEQLEKQDRHHREQLSVQREENTRARLHDVAASILSALAQGRTANSISDRGEKRSTFSDILSQFSIDIERFHLDVPGPDEEIYYVIQDLALEAFKAGRASKDHEAASNDDVDALFGWTGGLLIAWIRGSEAQRRVLIEGGKFSVRYILENGISAWNELSREGKMAGNPVPGRDASEN